MTNEPQEYNIAAIRELLLAAFTAESLPRFCLDDSYFEPIVASFGPNHNLNQMADEVIAYCQTQVLLGELLAAVREKNPRQYDRFKDRLHRPASTADAPPSPPVPPEPPPSLDTEPPLCKTVLSKPIVWLVLAALILLVVICLLFFKPPAVTVALETTHGRYVTAMADNWDPPWVLRAETEKILACEKFTLLCQGDVPVALQTCHKTGAGNSRYVTALGGDHDWLLIAQTDVIDTFERFAILDVDTGKVRWCPEVIYALKRDGQVRVALKTVHNRYVTAMDGNWHQSWVLRAKTNVVRASEIFTMTLLP